MITIVVLSALDGHIGQLSGPFTLAVQALDSGSEKKLEAQLLPVIAHFVRTVAAGVSCYNKQPFEISSNLNSYAIECFAELKIEVPEAAALLENLTFDCRRLPDALRARSIWNFDRAILRTLPGVNFIE
jgi:hypothetical protein